MMRRRNFLLNALRGGLLVTVPPAIALAGEGDIAEHAGGALPQPYADFHALPIYRCYVRGLQYRGVKEGFVEALDVPQPLDLVKEPDNRHDRRAIAVYAEGQQLGYLPREDNLILEKLIRRGIPVACRLVGVQPDEESYRRLSVEVALLYPPHPTTDQEIEAQEAARLDGLAKVAGKPTHRRRVTGDPLSAGHVYADYYGHAAGVEGFVG